MLKNISRPVLASTLALTVMAGLISGCNIATPENTAQSEQTMQDRIAQLEAENELLRSQNTNSGQDTQGLQASGDSEPLAKGTGYIAFNDVKDLPTYEFIDDLNQLGIFNGLVTGPTFDPYKPITRGEYVTWLYKAYNALRPENDQIRLAPQVSQIFKDLPPTHPSYKYVQAMSEAGFSVGYVDGTFRPDAPITREEMVGIKFGADTGTEHHKPSYYNDISYADRDKIDERYKGYVYFDWWQGGGPHKGNINRAFGKTKVFKPAEPVLRHEAAATLWQVDKGGTYTAENKLATTKTR